MSDTNTENKFISFVKQNPMVIGGVAVVVLVLIIVVIIVLMSKKSSSNGNNNATPNPTPKTKEGFSYSNYDDNDILSLSNMTEEDAERLGMESYSSYSNSPSYNSYDSDDIIENFPQATPMNVMYSDVNGNLATTTDVGLQNLTVNGDSNLNGNILSRGCFGGAGTQLATDVVVAGKGYNGRLHLLGDDVYVMAKNGVRIATDPNKANTWGPANGNLTVDNSITAGGALSAGSIGTSSVNIYNYGDVKTKMEELYNRVASLETRAGGVEGRAGTLEGRADTLKGRADTLEGRANSIETTLSTAIKVGDTIRANSDFGFLGTEGYWDGTTNGACWGRDKSRPSDPDDNYKRTVFALQRA